MSKKRALTGIRASGNLHIGNYLAAIKEGLKLQAEHDCLFFIADMHSLTTNKDPKLIREQGLDVAAGWIACGLDINQHLLYRQSDLPMVAEFAWYLSCATGMGFLQKAHSYKDSVAKDKEVSHGVFAYPVLMAADITMYDADIVPVGKDQKQHVEMARDMAGSINALYGEGTLKLPEVAVRENVMTIPGLDGRKMSKSYGNEIALFSSEKGLKQQVMSITTDSTPLEEPKELDGSLLGDLFKLFGSDEQYGELRKKLAAGGYGWGHAKQDLLEVIVAELGPARKLYLEIREDEAELERTLERGKEKALAIAVPVLNRLRNAVGFRSLSYS